MRLLVTGGAGYIGSVVSAQLLRAGHDVAVLDDLSTGHEDSVPPGAVFIRGSIREKGAPVLAERGIDAVLHFAASSLVGESVANPAKYWANNLGGTLALLDAMRLAGTGRVIFSSTAAVYGEADRIPIEETSPTRPTSPYGASKLAVDTALTEAARLHGLGAVSLRYFNVAWRAAGRRRQLAPRAALPGDPSDPQRARGGGGRAASARQSIRRRLPHTRWHLHPGLHPRDGPCRRAPAGA